MWKGRYHEQMIFLMNPPLYFYRIPTHLSPSQLFHNLLCGGCGWAPSLMPAEQGSVMVLSSAFCRDHTLHETCCLAAAASALCGVSHLLLPICSQNCMVSIDTHLPRKVHFKGNSCSSKRQQIAVKWRINAFSRLGQSSCKASEEPGPSLHRNRPKLRKGGWSRLFVCFLNENTHTHKKQLLHFLGNAICYF